MPPVTNPIIDLLARALSKDQAAARELFKSYGPHILGTIRRKLLRIVRSKLDSIDIAQMVWLDFFDKVLPYKNFDSPGHLIAFLTCMAENVVFKVHRQYLDTERSNVRRERTLQHSEDAAELTDPSMDPAAIASMRDEWDHLLAIKSERFQDVVRRLRDGDSLADICTALDLHERTIRRLLQDPRLGPNKGSE